MARPMAVRATATTKRKKSTKAKTAPRAARKVEPRAGLKASEELEKFRSVLLTERERLEAELQEIESRTARTSESERANELSGYEDHPADLASETFEREKDIAIAESVESLLHRVETALEKLERGSYGICDACGRPIKKARLRALPFATLCLACQDRLEG
jgi:RNA polymerase-binding protein DksA